MAAARRRQPRLRANLARALTNFGNRLSDLGRTRDALDAAEEAVGLWRPLAGDNPDYQPDLARALNNLGYRLSDLGRAREALDAAEEALGL